MSQNHDIVVIGASHGGIEVLVQILRDLPADLPASVFIVQHIPERFPSALPEIFSRAAKLPATHALHGEKIELGHIYVASPDTHLALRRGHIQVVRGPKENNHRPAVDVLFRTAAQSYGPRVVGVVLSGALDCGTAGLRMIQARGGATIIQSPNTATCGDMPANALAYTKPDYLGTPTEIGGFINTLVREAISSNFIDSPDASELPRSQGTSIALTCPECNGSLAESDRDGILLFACHVGHAYSLQSMVAEQSDAMEAALWAAVRALEESSALALRTARYCSIDLISRFQEKSAAMQQHAATLRHVIFSGTLLVRADGYRTP